jgi:hypothetical protein
MNAVTNAAIGAIVTPTNVVTKPTDNSDRIDPFTWAVAEELAGAHRRRVSRRGRRPDWFACCVFLIPRDVREQWFGHIREDRAEMTRARVPGWWIETCTMWHVLRLSCQSVLSLGLQVWDIVHRFK